MVTQGHTSSVTLSHQPLNDHPVIHILIPYPSITEETHTTHNHPFTAPAPTVVSDWSGTQLLPFIPAVNIY